jgi:hypothetical protein
MLFNIFKQHVKLKGHAMIPHEMVAEFYTLVTDESEACNGYHKFLAKWIDNLSPSQILRIEEKIRDEEIHLIDDMAMAVEFSQLLPMDDGLSEALATLNGEDSDNPTFEIED